MDLCSLTCEMSQFQFPFNSTVLSEQPELYTEVLFTCKSNVVWLRVERNFEGHSAPLPALMAESLITTLPSSLAAAGTIPMMEPSTSQDGPF